MKRRTTIQRLKILEYLKSVKSHPTAEIIYKQVVKEVPTMTLATTYRNLNVLEEDGEIRKLEISGEKRYDADCACHQHCICKKCHRIIDLCQEKISKYAINNFKAEQFEPNSVTIIFHGICKNCKK